MEEARISFNVRFNFKGYDSQVTLRSDEDVEGLLEELMAALDSLGELGATPARRWEEARNNNSKPVAPAQPKPVAPVNSKPVSRPKPVCQPKPKSAQVQPKPRQEDVCPEHGIAAASKFGGLYCPTKLEDGSWCPWRSDAGEELPF